MTTTDGPPAGSTRAEADAPVGTGPARERPRSGGARRGSVPWSGRVLLGVASLLVFLALWQLVYVVTGTDGVVLASPGQTLASLGEQLASAALYQDLWATGQELLIGLLIGFVVGVPVGIVIGMSQLVSFVAQPWVSVAYSTPLIALTPLFILYFGLGIWSKIAVVALVAVAPIIINTTLGVRSVDTSMIEVMQSFHARRRQLFAKLYLPASLPYITTGLRLALGRGITAVVAAEFLGSTEGMGFRLLQAAQSFSTDQLLAQVILLAFTGAGLMLLVEQVDTKVFGRWRADPRR